MSSYNIGPKIGIDGEAEFRKQIRDINAEYKTMEAQTRAVTAAFEANGDEQGRLEALSAQLVKELDKQIDKQLLLEDAVEKASAKFGENSVEANRLRGALYDTQATISGLEMDLKDTTDALDNMSEETSVAKTEMDQFLETMGANLAASAIWDTLKEGARLLMDFGQEAIEAAADVRASSSQFSQAFGEMELQATAALNSISDETGITTTRMQDSYTRLYAFTKTAGAESGEALDIANRAMMAAADSAAYYDKSIEDTTETLQSFLKGNYENDAALGISCTETTRNTEANKLYAKSFNELSESQKIDVLLSMVEAANEVSGALGQAARESDSWANVTGELDEAWRLFQAAVGDPVLQLAIPIVQDLTEALEWLTDAVEKAGWERLNDDVKEFSGTLEGVAGKIATASAEADGAAAAAGYYIDRLEELGSTGLDTAESQEDYAAVIRQLNDLIPGLNLQVDEQTGLLKTNTDELRDNVAAWAEEEKAEAQMEASADAANAYEAALESLSDARAQLMQKEAEAEATQAKLNAVISAGEGAVNLWMQALIAGAQGADLLTVSTDAFSEATRLNAIAAAEDQQAVADLQRQLFENKNEQDALTESIANAEQTLEGYKDAVAQGEQALDDYETQVDDTTQAMADMEAQNGETADSQGPLMSEIEATSETLEELEQAYQDACEGARDSVDQQIGFFDQLSAESDMTGQEIIDNWIEQQKAFENYAANLQKAADMGIDEIIIQQFADGSEESMLRLDALVNDSELTVDEINQAWYGMQEGREIVKDQLEGYSQEVRDAKQSLYDAGYESGAYMGDGLVSGLKSKRAEVREASAALAEEADDAIHAVAGINSPARMTIEDGRFIGQGLAVGMDDELNENRKAAERQIQAIQEGLAAKMNPGLSARISRAASYADIYTPGPSIERTTIDRTKSVSYGNVTMQIYQQPGESGEAMAQRIMELLQDETERKEVSFGAYGS